ncbi:MAG: hypothetical protein GEU83_13485 [Pseudonocardiaceae bacterium]|nr:hypothetical protein [Pseudonocardiaceae bacterium]
MITRKLAGVSAGAVGAATAVTALLLGAASGSAQPEFNDSAYGIAAEGLVPIDPTPSVESTDGEVVTDELLELPQPLGVGVLKVEAGGNAAKAQALDVNIAEQLELRVLTTTCDNAQGDVELIGGLLGGEDLPSEPAPGETIDASPLATVELNKQTENEDGTLTVEGLVLTLLPPGDAAAPLASEDFEQLEQLAPEQLQLPAEAPATVGDLRAQLEELNTDLPIQQGEALLTVTLTSATCGAEEEAPAPKPEPVETDLPVTG